MNSVGIAVRIVVVALPLGACTGSVTSGGGRGRGRDGNGGGAGGRGGGGSSDAVGGQGGADARPGGAAGTDTGTGDGGGADRSPPPDGGASGQWDPGAWLCTSTPLFGDKESDDPPVPPYLDAASLCSYVNASRPMYGPHEPNRGCPGAGEDTTRTWPLTFKLDPALMAEAQAEAERLAKGGVSKNDCGKAEGKGGLKISGENTDSYAIAAYEEICDYPKYPSTSQYPGLSRGNGFARMGLYYHDFGGYGPVLTRMGCGAADMVGSDGKAAMWWVVRLGK